MARKRQSDYDQEGHDDRDDLIALNRHDIKELLEKHHHHDQINRISMQGLCVWLQHLPMKEGKQDLDRLDDMWHEKIILTDPNALIRVKAFMHTLGMEVTDARRKDPRHL